ncbi:MAG: autotransporter domain-containing protein [Rhodobiaceae bacterium]|nr:autotransporter domain-containing protein [Rhodobiaceae bacterium]
MAIVSVFQRVLVVSIAIGSVLRTALFLLGILVLASFDTSAIAMQNILPSNQSVGQLVQAVATDANGIPTERTNVIDGPNGFQLVEFIDIATGQIVSVVQSNTPNAGGNTGNNGGGNAGGISAQQAGAQVDGARSVTNPSTVDGDVLKEFGVASIFPSAQNGGGFGAFLNQAADGAEKILGGNDDDEDGDSGNACDKCKQELAELEVEHAGVVTALFEALKEFEAVVADDEKAERFLNNDPIRETGEESEQDIIDELRHLAESEGLSDEQINDALAQAQADGQRPEVQAEHAQEIEEVQAFLAAQEGVFDELRAEHARETQKFANLVSELEARISAARGESRPIDEGTKKLAREVNALLDDAAAGGGRLGTTGASFFSLGLDLSFDLRENALADSQARDFRETKAAINDAENRLSKLLFETPAIALFKQNLIDKLDEVPARVDATNKLQALQDREKALSEEIVQKRAQCAIPCRSAGQSSRMTVPSRASRARVLLASAPGAPRSGFGPNSGIAAFIGEQRFNAQFDLRQFRQTQRRRYVEAAGVGASVGERVDPSVEDGRPILDLPGVLNDSRFNLFGAASVSFGENDTGSIDQDSVSYSISGGASMLVNPELNIGLAVRYGDGDIDSQVSTIDTSTWGIAAFAQTQFDSAIGQINLEGIVAYSRSDVDSRFIENGVTTTTDTLSTAFSSQIKASTGFAIDAFTLSPSVSVSYIGTDREAFTLSDGQFQNGVTGDQVTFSAGASLSREAFEIPETDWSIAPSVGLSTFGSLTNGNDNLGLSTNAGLGIQSKTGTSIGFGVGYSGFTGDARNLSLSANVKIPF